MSDAAARIPARRIAIAGASSGIGAALARGLAAPGRDLHLCARRPEPLAALAEYCRERGAGVATEALDLVPEGAGARWLARVEATGPVDLLIVAAGIFGGAPAPGQAAPEALSRAILRTNLAAPVALAEAAACRMRGRGHGRIVLIGSLAARDPLPDARAYCAAKAGLAHYAVALRAELQGSGVQVMLVEPGHVATRQTRQHRGPLPLLIPVEEAAARILRAMARDRPRLAFPRRAALALALLDLVPWRLRLALTRAQRFTVDNPPVDPPVAPASDRGRKTHRCRG